MMKNYVKRSKGELRVYEKSKILIENSIEWTYLRIGIQRLVDENKKNIVFYSELLENVLFKDSKDDHLESLNQCKGELIKLEKMLTDLEVENEIEWKVK